MERVTDMKNLLKRFKRCKSGVTAIEYGLIAALIAVVIIAALGSIGSGLNNKFSTIANKIDGTSQTASDAGAAE